MGLFKDCGCGCGGAKARSKFIISIISALIFFIVANPSTFIIMRQILGSWVSGPNGCPTIMGLVMHTFVFFLIVWGMMHIQKEGFSGQEEASEDEDEDEDDYEDDYETYMSEIAFAPSPNSAT